MKRNVFLILIMIVLVTGSVFCQIGLNPEAVFISREDNTGLLSLTNFNLEPYEVTISFKYGYPVFDSTGKSFLSFSDTVTAPEHSLVPFIRAFPKRLILKPGKEQVVRIMAMNTAGLADGTYWARIIIHSGPVSKVIDTSRPKDISVNMRVVTELVAPILYHKGSLRTSLNLSSIDCSTDSQFVRISLGLEKGGNSPSIGIIRLEIIDSDGNRIENITEPLPVYFNTKKYFVFEKSRFKPGAYTFVVNIDDDVPSFPKDRKVSFGDITKEFKFEIR